MRTSESHPQGHWTVRSSADLGRAVAGVRRKNGLTQQALAEQAGFDRSYLVRLEAGAETLLLERALRALRRMGAVVEVTLPGDDGSQT